MLLYGVFSSTTLHTRYFLIFVLGTFFSDNPTFLNIIKWIGVIYLLYLAYDVYKSSPKEINSEIVTSKSFFSFFKDGFLVAGTSPKAWLFFPLIFPQFIDFNSNYIVQFYTSHFDCYSLCMLFHF